MHTDLSKTLQGFGRTQAQVFEHLSSKSPAPSVFKGSVLQRFKTMDYLLILTRTDNSGILYYNIGSILQD
jgi:hypothetical protein